LKANIEYPLYLSLIDQIIARKIVGDTRENIWYAYIMSASRLNTVLCLDEEYETQYHCKVKDIAYQYCGKATLDRNGKTSNEYIVSESPDGNEVLVEQKNSQHLNFSRPTFDFGLKLYLLTDEVVNGFQIQSIKPACMQYVKIKKIIYGLYFISSPDKPIVESLLI